MTKPVNDPILIPVERRSLPAQVATRIHDQILSGVYSPGPKLPHQRDLALNFGVSAAVIREALARLKGAGLVRAKSGQGTFVTNQPLKAMRFPTWVRDPASSAELSEAIEARDVIEHATAMRAAQRRTPKDVEHLREIIVRMADASEDALAFIACDIEFHLTVASASGNQILTGALSALQRSLSESVAVGVQDAIDNKWMPTLVDSHAQLVDAIVERDPVVAGEVMDTMFARLRTIVEKSGVTVDPWPRP